MKAAFILTLLLLVPPASVAEEKPTVPPKQIFDLKHTELQKLLRAAITVERSGFLLQPVRHTAQEIPSTRVAASLGNMGQPPLRRPATTECREFECNAYDEKGNVLYTTPTPTPVVRIPDLTKEGQLRCLSTNDMLPTWERVATCDR